ncbi:MAG: DUF2934 domain-containing protein [Burkholderiales bacterium]|nr:DUF2934 domain-containing protein [Burkholderiales bacterium]
MNHQATDLPILPQCRDVPPCREAPCPDPGGARAARIAERAYFRAQQRGFAPGHELDDWLAAEREVDALPARSG